jgi:exodeoxyribonuclease-5
VLTGYAGTGKTYITARLIAVALHHIPGALGKRSGWAWDELPAVVIAAPTHKAARQLERALAAHGIDNKVRAATLHSALGLRPVREEGQESFEPDPKATPLVGADTRLVFVDEASMVSARLAGLLEQVMPPDAALVAIGDPAQLQPVDDPAPSPLFKAPIRAHLNEVMRHGGPILELATKVRELGAGRPPFEACHFGGSDVAVHPDYGTWRRAAFRACIEAHRAGDTDRARILSWTNAAADKLNSGLHRAIYGQSAPPYVPGQPVVSAGAIPGPDGTPLVGSTAELRLIEVTPAAGPISGDELRCVREALLGKRRTKAGEQLPPTRWWEISAVIAGRGGRPIAFKVLDPIHQPSYRKATNAIAAMARAEKEAGNTQAAKDLWRLYWQRKDAFAAISPVWALTIHKSQGSTFERVFMHPDVGRNTDLGSMNQLTYVGITRASKALHVVADRLAQEAAA